MHSRHEEKAWSCPTAARQPWRAALHAAVIVAVACCGTENEEPVEAEPTVESAARSETGRARVRMVEVLRATYDFQDERILAAMAAIPRHRFVPASWRHLAYGDHALPIGFDQTISQPYIVATMTAAARLPENARVLEVGTGSGYQAAVLAELGAEVFSIEIVRPLGERSARLLDELGYDRVQVRIGDGYRGWPDEAPFDAILLTAAPDHVPEPLRAQLKVGGRLVMPVGDRFQELVVETRTPDGFEREKLLDVRFVPMTGEAERHDR